MLNSEQIQELTEFFEGPIGTVLFAMLEGMCIADWMAATSTAEREELWRLHKTIESLQVLLRDAPAMKRMTERNQERRMYNGTTTGV